MSTVFAVGENTNEPVHSLQTLLADLGPLGKNRVRAKSQASSEFHLLTQPTPHRHRTIDLLGASLALYPDCPHAAIQQPIQNLHQKKQLPAWGL